MSRAFFSTLGDEHAELPLVGSGTVLGGLGPDEGLAVLTSSQIDRCVGVVIGSAAGDALGAGYEFGPAVTGPVEMIGGGSFGWRPGEWTDDTQMASAILAAGVTARAEGRAVALAEVAAGFLAWYRSGPADVGIQTRAVLRSAASAQALAAAAARFQQQHPDSAGNGSLMRTGPVAVCAVERPEDEVARLAAAISDLTHPHPDCRAACVLQRTLEAAVRPGGDTDTVAAITGALLGAAWGATAVPTLWRRSLNGQVVSASGVDRIDGRELEHWARLAAAGTNGQG